MLDHDFIALGILLIVAVGICGGMLAVPRLLGPKDSTGKLLDVFECGVPLHDASQRRLQVKFYLVALVFIVFDVETVFLLPWAVLFREFIAQGRGSFVFLEVLFFLAVLTLGLAFLWRKGGLEWE
jgi:NADH-quinone oxidoreductase subunit A